ncbi:MAG: Crp/Fnr family transcriptional regulator [Methylobacteriaceae bacterium]|nr:Crp/Fnr family transcriptional regulator [Methylobacteriaceae bacterium]
MAPEESRILDRCLLFRVLDERSRSELLARARRSSFAAGLPIFHLGDPGQSMMAVLTGTVRVSLPTLKGRTIVLADLPAGEVFGEVALLDGKERSADATALTNCELLVLERRDVLPFLERHPAVCLKLMELLCARLRLSDDRMVDITFFELPVRLAKTLLRRAKAPARALEGIGHPRVSDSQSELANMIGNTRENVNRCLRDWQRRGILDLQDGWIVILHREALEILADPAAS